jgi:hypothetical protein
LLDYNEGDNWRQRIVPVPQKGYKEDEEAIVIPDDHSFLRSKYRDDPEFQTYLHQSMDFPSHELRAISRSYENNYTSFVEMVIRLNKLQVRYVRTVAEGILIKLKKEGHKAHLVAI